jgi:hypothetical protein
MQGFMMGSPNAAVCHFCGVGLILDDLERAGCCGGAANVPRVGAGGRPEGADAGGGGEGGEGAGRPATIRVETALCMHLRRQAMRIQSCSLSAVIEVVKARLVRLLRSLGRCDVSRWVRQT